MKSAISRKLLAFVGCLLLVFGTAVLIVINMLYQQTARQNALRLLEVFEREVVDCQLATDEQLIELVERYGDKVYRVTVIAMDGSVIADSEIDSVDGFDSHADRNEIVEAKRGEVGVDVRSSNSIGDTNFLYIAKRVSIEGNSSSRTIVLRLAMPMDAINGYIWAVIASVGLVFIVAVIVSGFIARSMATNILSPYALIKDKLDVDSPDRTISLTKFDELNAILSEIDSLAERLNRTLSDNMAQKQKLASIIESVDQGVLALDEQDNVIIANARARKMLGVVCELPAPMQAYFKNADVLHSVGIVKASHKSIALDVESQGKIFSYTLTSSPTADIKTIVVVQDVTDIRRLAELKQQFFENAGHELKTPLASIMGFSEIMLTKGKTDLEFVKIINKEATRMNTLIGDMFKVSELESGAMIEDEALALEGVVEEVVKLFLPIADAKGITLSSQLQPTKIRANRDKIVEVVSNLIDNAIKYTDRGGRVTVCIQLVDGRVCLSVEDNGIGIPSDLHNRIFERFFRVDKGRSRKEGGTGLGLAIVKHILSHYNAPISVASQPGQGTRISASFPAI